MTRVAAHSPNFHLTWQVVDDHLKDDLSTDSPLDWTFSHLLLESEDSRHGRRKSSRHSDARLGNFSPGIAKLIRTGVVLELGDCISVSKSSVVFVAVRGMQAPEGWPEQFAVKVRRATLKFNLFEGFFSTETVCLPKPVAQFAKSEYRNIIRIYSHALPSPCPLMIEKDVVVMELISENGVPAPSLRDAKLTLEEYDELYDQVLIGIRRTFHRCGLIRADLSEHTILVRGKRAVWTGGARVIERDSENASMVLRRGIATLTNFFKQTGIQTVPMMLAFQFIVARRLEDGFRATLAKLRKEQERMSVEEFVGRFAPHTLAEVTDAELAQGLVRVEGQPLFDEEEEAESEWKSALGLENESDEDDSEEEDIEPIETLDRKMFTKEEWKEKRREIKAANRERRRAHKPRLEKREQNRRCHRNAK